ncbi:MAG: hypothetical protein LDL39_07795 [Magnetospirillum sp.]|nr:hypothetical protein [Magnetospirillum sp.]
MGAQAATAKAITGINRFIQPPPHKIIKKYSFCELPQQVKQVFCSFIELMSFYRLFYRQSLRRQPGKLGENAAPQLWHGLCFIIPAGQALNGERLAKT